MIFLIASLEYNGFAPSAKDEMVATACILVIRQGIMDLAIDTVTVYGNKKLVFRFMGVREFVRG